VLVAVMIDTASADADTTLPDAGTERSATKVDPPWRTSPEGLTVFLI
jgi:hypothetical protein